jgi:hypothetical protein
LFLRPNNRVGGITHNKSDLRGKHCKKGRDTETIKRHIMSFHPQISHYRREHAPRKLYLPSEITITDMHKDYVSKFGKISYSTYYKEISDLNISFTKLGEEQCEICDQFLLHSKSNPEIQCECAACMKYPQHKAISIKARENYESDKKSDLLAYAVDLQKVVFIAKNVRIQSSTLYTKACDFQ